MRFLVRVESKEVARGALLATMKSLVASVGIEARNPKWTSYGALELDIFSPTRADFELLLAAVGPIAAVEFITDLNKPPAHITDEEATSRARELFNAERYWECHEILEGLWRQKLGEEKSLLQGIILVCAAFVHHQKGEEGVALSVLERGSRQLAHSGRLYGGIDIGFLVTKVQDILRARRMSEFKV